MATIERDEIVKTEITVQENGSVWIHVEKHAGGDDTFQFLYQSLGLTVEQSKDLYEQLKEHFEDATDDETDGLLDHLYDDTTLPEEPEEAGLYVTQNGILLIKDDDGDWSYRKYPYELMASWSAECVSLWEDDWKVVVTTLGDDAFPLKHITISDIMSIAAQQPCDPATVSDELETPLQALQAAIDKAAIKRLYH